MYKIAVLSCAQNTKTLCTKYITEDPLVQAVYLNGDFGYIASYTSPQYGVTPQATNTISMPPSEWVKRFNFLFGMQQMQELMAMRQRGVKIFWEGDDHQCIGDNWDFSVAQLNSITGPTPAATLATEVLTHWRAALAGTALIEAMFDNPPRGVNTTDQPAAMVGVGTSSPADYPVRYFYNDFGPAGARIRCIKLDCISYKSTIASTDNASKTMLGATQKAWKRQVVADAVASGCVAVMYVSGKDLFNVQNQDGWFNYSTERDAELLYDSQRNYPTVWACGDRHNPHASLCRVDSGDPYNVLAIGACPFAVGASSLLTAYPQNAWQIYRRPKDNSLMADALVFQMTTVDDVNRVTRHAIIEAATGQELKGWNIPFGSNLPV